MRRSDMVPPKTLFNRFIRWSKADVFDQIFAALAFASSATGAVMIDATHLKAHRTAASLLKKGLFPAASDVRKGELANELQTARRLRWYRQAVDI